MGGNTDPETRPVGHRTGGPEPSREARENGVAVRARNVTKTFGKLIALDQLDLTVPAGMLFGLIGPNGAGKTTLIRLMMGLARSTKGELTVLGRRPPDRELASQVGYMPQADALYGDLSAEENLEFFASIYGLPRAEHRSRVREVLELVDLAHAARRSVEAMSGGMRQRLSLAVALVHSPKMLVLDEPTVGIDPELRVAFWAHFRKLSLQGKTVIVSTHHLDEAERCDIVAMLRQGRLIARDTPENLRRTAGTETLEKAFLKFAEVPAQ